MDFDNRRDELSGLVSDFLVKSQLWVGERPEDVRQAASMLAKQEQDAFTATVPSYCDVRDQKLTELIDAMSRQIGPDSNPESAWRAPCDALKSSAESMLGGMLRSIIDPTPLAKGFHWGISESEKKFCDGLAGVGIAYAWKALGLFRNDDVVMVLALERQWALLQQKAVEIYQKASPYATRIADILDNSPGRADPELAQLGIEADNLAKVASRAASSSEKLADLRSGAEGALNAYSRALDGIERVTRAWQLTIDQAKSDVAVLRGLQAAEIEALHRVYKERCKEARDFVNEPNPAKAEAIIGEIKSRFNSWQGSLAYEGQRRDADEIIVELVKQLNPVLDQIRDDFKKFQELYRGIFIDSVSDETIEKLTRDDDWDDLRKRFVDRRPAETLTLVKQGIEDRTVDADSLVNTLATAVAGRTGDSESDKTAMGDLVNRARSEVVPKFQGYRDALCRVCDQGVAVLGSSELAAVMNRRDVIASLKS